MHALGLLDLERLKEPFAKFVYSRSNNLGSKCIMISLRQLWKVMVFISIEAAKIFNLRPSRFRATKIEMAACIGMIPY